MRATKSVLGWLLIVLSLSAVIQTAREIGLWEIGGPRYAERSISEPVITFAGRTVAVADNLARTASGSQSESESVVQLRIDGQPNGDASRAGVRMGLADLGRYHGWLDAWVFVTRSDGDSSLWVARRLQATAGDPVRFEQLIIHSNGVVDRRLVRGWQLAFDYRSFRSTQFVRSSEWEVLPLDLNGVAGFFPILLLLFPVGTFIGGMVLLRRSRFGAPAV